MFTLTFEQFLYIPALILFIIWLTAQLRKAKQDESGCYDNPESGIVDVYGSKGYRYMR